MKNRLVVLCSITFIMIIIISIILFINTKIQKEHEALKRDIIDAITLKPGEIVYIDLGEYEYKLELKEIRKNTPCPEENSDPLWPCAWVGEYTVVIELDDIEFYIDSEFNYSVRLDSTNLNANYIIYYVPEYDGKEATFFLEYDINYEKEKNLIIGNYLVYINDYNKVVNIKTFTNREHTWNKNYIGKDLEDIEEMIKQGMDLTKEK
jgi:hypothetical protein